MKTRKILALLMAALMIVALAACNSEPAAPTTDAPAADAMKP